MMEKKRGGGGALASRGVLILGMALGSSCTHKKKLRGFSFYNGTNGGSSSTKWSFKIFSTYLWNGKKGHNNWLLLLMV
jgi:hypothetical protein